MSQSTCLTPTLTVCFLSLSSVPLLQSQADAPAEQEAGPVHLAAVGRQHRPADDDPHLAQLAGGVHQQLALQLGRQQLLRSPVGRRDQVRGRFRVGHLRNTVTPPCKSPHRFLLSFSSSKLCWKLLNFLKLFQFVLICSFLLKTLTHYELFKMKKFLNSADGPHNLLPKT